jgi:hypothetical protein
VRVTQRSRILVALTGAVLLTGFAPTATAFVWRPAPGSPYAPSRGAPNSIAVGDFNGDGLPDVAVGSLSVSPSNTVGSSAVYVLLADGSGGFRPYTGLGGASLGRGPARVATGDFNGDHRLDVVATNEDNLTVLLGHGDGTLTPAPGSPIALGNSANQVAVGDLNGDGKADVVTLGGAAEGSLSVLLGNGNGTFRAAPGSPTSVGSAGQGKLAMADFNGDGNLDLAITNPATGSLSVLLGNGNGTFRAAPGSPISLGVGGPYWIVVGDFNGDRRPDVATQNFDSAGNSSLSVLLGNGNGTFAEPIGSPVALPQSCCGGGGLAAGDFNADGKQDLVFTVPPVTSEGLDGVDLLLGDGAGHFSFAHGSPFTLPGSPLLEVLAGGTFDGRPGVLVYQGPAVQGAQLGLLLAPLPSDPPTATLALTPDRGLAGSRVKLDASASSDPLDRTIVDYRWDLGSGRFTYDSGTSASITRTFSGGGRVHVRVQVTNSAGETAVANAQLLIYPRRRTAAVAGYVQRCAGRAARRCSIGIRQVCRQHVGCVTPDRVVAVNTHGRRAADEKLRHARFYLRLVPGRYSIELLGDGKRVHGRIVQRRTITVRARQTVTVRFRFAVP